MEIGQLMRQIIAKQDDIIYLLSLNDAFFNVRIAVLNEEVTVLKADLKQAESEVTEYELETLKLTPIPSGWICPRCQKVHNWMVQSCDCSPNVITASTTDPIPGSYLNDCIERATPNLSKIKDVDRELEEIRGIKQTCTNCKYAQFRATQYPCSECNWGEHDLKWEPIK